MAVATGVLADDVTAVGEDETAVAGTVGLAEAADVVTVGFAAFAAVATALGAG